MDSVHDRFIGYQFDEQDCHHGLFQTPECYHLKLKDKFGKNNGLHAFQLGKQKMLVNTNRIIGLLFLI